MGHDYLCACKSIIDHCRLSAPAVTNQLQTKRVSLLLATAAYAGTLYFAYVHYLHPVWDYFGFKFAAPDNTRVAMGAFFLLLTSLSQPTNIGHPAPLSLFVLYFNVYIPSVVVTLTVSSDSSQRYGAILSALTAVFVIAGLLLRNQRVASGTTTMPEKLGKLMWALWLAAASMLLVNYYEVMSLSTGLNIEDIYEQRVAGTASTPVLAYTQTFFSSVFSPGLLAIGIAQRSKLAVLAAIAGAIMMYAITAQRTILLLPAIMLLVHHTINWRVSRSYAPSIILCALATVFLCSTLFYEESFVAGVLALMVTFRTIAIPGLTLSQYEDLFSTIGRTNWAHVKGVDLFIAKPEFAQAESLWPNLGYIVGDQTYNNPIFNVNANLFAGDGVAAGGAFGVLVIGAVFIAWLKLLERACKGWPNSFTCLAFLPIAIAMTNGHFFTTMLSFGGIFWIVIMIGMNPSRGSLKATDEASWDSGPDK